jgi:hypothetical protein
MTIPRPRTAGAHARFCSVLLLAASFAFAAPAGAQDRKGFWIGAGFGVGTAALSINEYDADRDWSSESHIDTGWTLSPHLLLGVRFDGFGVQLVSPQLDLDTGTFFFDLLGTVTIYPRASHGFFIRGGVGPSFMDDDTDDGHAIGGLGISALASAGYDFPLGRRFALTPAVSYRFDRVNDVTLDDSISLGNWRNNVLAFTVSFTLK